MITPMYVYISTAAVRVFRGSLRTQQERTGIFSAVNGTRAPQPFEAISFQKKGALSTDFKNTRTSNKGLIQRLQTQENSPPPSLHAHSWVDQIPKRTEPSWMGSSQLWQVDLAEGVVCKTNAYPSGLGVGWQAISH